MQDIWILFRTVCQRTREQRLLIIVSRSSDATLETSQCLRVSLETLLSTITWAVSVSMIAGVPLYPYPFTSRCSTQASRLMLNMLLINTIFGFSTTSFSFFHRTGSSPTSRQCLQTRTTLRRSENVRCLKMVKRSSCGRELICLILQIFASSSSGFEAVETLPMIRLWIRSPKIHILQIVQVLVQVFATFLSVSCCEKGPPYTQKMWKLMLYWAPNYHEQVRTLFCVHKVSLHQAVFCNLLTSQTIVLPMSCWTFSYFLFIDYSTQPDFPVHTLLQQTVCYWALVTIAKVRYKLYVPRLYPL